jgi:hypothetical protein
VRTRHRAEIAWVREWSLRRAVPLERPPIPTNTFTAEGAEASRRKRRAQRALCEAFAYSAAMPLRRRDRIRRRTDHPVN